MLKLRNGLIESEDFSWLLFDGLVLWDDDLFDFLFFSRFFLLDFYVAQTSIDLVLGYLVYFSHLTSLSFLDDFGLSFLVLIPLVSGFCLRSSCLRLLSCLHNIKVC
jgi:hypothetical protein